MHLEGVMWKMKIAYHLIYEPDTSRLEGMFPQAEASVDPEKTILEEQELSCSPPKNSESEGHTESAACLLGTGHGYLSLGILPK